MKFKKVRTKKDIERDPRVLDFWSEQQDSFGNGSRTEWWAYLAPGWECQSTGCRTVHETTVGDVCDRINSAKFQG